VKEKIIFIVGPTAIGKSDIAVSLAKKINGEIISCDSMQIYKGMDVITSKPGAALWEEIPHHLISVLSADKEYNVSRYYRDAARKIKEVLKRGRMPLIVGGTGLYMSILLDGIFKLTPKVKLEGIRRKLIQKAKKQGSVKLYKELLKVDPEAAAKIHPNDAKRIIRALEVFEATGEPISKLQKQRKGLRQQYSVKIFGLNMPRERLYRKIDERVEKMFDGGLLDEVRRLLKIKLSKTAAYAIGIKELKGYFEGLYGLDEAKRLIKRNTRLYAKRQMTWFRKDKRINWIKAGEYDKPAVIASKIQKKMGSELFFLCT